MIYSLARSLDVDLVFDDRSYTLGDTIEVKVELDALRDVKMRNGRVDLVYQVRWVAPNTEHRLMGRLTRPGPGGHIVNSYALRVPTKKMVEHKHSYVLGSASFLERTRLEAHENGRYDIRIHIHGDDPPSAFVKGAAMGWRLVVAVDVVRAPDVTMGKDVKIIFKPAAG